MASNEARTHAAGIEQELFNSKKGKPRDAGYPTSDRSEEFKDSATKMPWESGATFKTAWGSLTAGQGRKTLGRG